MNVVFGLGGNEVDFFFIPDIKYCMQGALSVGMLFYEIIWLNGQPGEGTQTPTLGSPEESSPPFQKPSHLSDVWGDTATRRAGHSPPKRGANSASGWNETPSQDNGSSSPPSTLVAQ